MPNTLAHFGVQALATKSFDRTADIKWIGLGCIIPDLPWISQRITSATFSVDLLDLRIYCMIQASLFFCLILSGAIAFIVNNPARIFLILSSNCLFHLLLDSLQTKLANGVHLAAPINWQLTKYALFWPESLMTLILTANGFGLILFYGRKDRNYKVHLIFRRIRLTTSAALISCYILLPFTFFQGPISANNHYVNTLKNNHHRTAQEIGFDRCYYQKEKSKITAFTGEQFTLINHPQLEEGKVSLIGTFLDQKTIDVKAIHQHGKIREVFSYIGLFMLILLWTLANYQKKITFYPKSK